MHLDCLLLFWVRPPLWTRKLVAMMWRHQKQVSKIQIQFWFLLSCLSRSHCPERASALDFKNAVTLRFGHSDVVFDLFIETCLSHLVALWSNFSKLFQIFRYYWTKNDLILCQKYHEFPLLSILLMINSRYLSMFVTKNRQKTISLWPNRGAGASLKSKADALSG